MDLTCCFGGTFWTRDVGLIAVIMFIECIDHCVYKKLMFCEEIYTGICIGASRVDAAESWDSFQLLSYDNCGRRKSLPCTQIFPDRQAPQRTSEDMERNVVT
jgi:hypothetical protein